MCGIAGILRRGPGPIEQGRLQAMVDHLHHRGPDGQGWSVHGSCAMVHTRLSVIDLLGGNQPMRLSLDDGKQELSLVFNGEIYNHRPLRRQLESLGHRFVSDHCDTEVLLHGYRQWGSQLPKHLHGMFAFAIWDSTCQSLFLCRDRSGKKPLYFWRLPSADGGEFLFASLIGTLLHGAPSNADPRINRQALRHYLQLGYAGHASLIEGIEELPAAHWMIVDAQGREKMERYWQVPPVSLTVTSLGGAEAVRQVLTEAVCARLEADVPLGAFLSGGVDSSFVCALAQDELKRRGAPALRTFHVSMPDEDYDESAAALQVARHLGTQHTQLTAQPGNSLIDDLQYLISTSGQPLGDSSILPTYWLSRATREHVVVAISGDGGDELFGGYQRYHALRLLARHRWWLGNPLVQTLLQPLCRPDPARPYARRTRMHRLLAAARGRNVPTQYLSMIQLMSPAMLSELLEDETGEQVQTGLPEWVEELEPDKAAMRWDLGHYLPMDLLRKVDQASMAMALEVRCPFLDTQVCDLAGHLPANVLCPGGRAKGLLKQAASRWLPEHILNRPKQGFVIPLGRWFGGPWRQPLQDHLLDSRLTELGMRKPVLSRMFEEHILGRVDHTHRLFVLLNLSLWLQWIDHPTQPSIPSRQTII